MEKGLYPKYTIIKNSTGEEVKRPSFILLPENDPHARAALRAYSDSVAADNAGLASDLRTWIEVIEPKISTALDESAPLQKWGYFLRNWGVGVNHTPLLMTEWDTQEEALADLRCRMGEYGASGRRVEQSLPDKPDEYILHNERFPSTLHYVAPIKG